MLSSSNYPDYFHRAMLKIAAVLALGMLGACAASQPGPEPHSVSPDPICESPQRECSGACVSCPEQNAVALGCDGTRCVATQCEAGFELYGCRCGKWISETVENSPIATNWSRPALVISDSVVHLAYTSAHCINNEMGCSLLRYAKRANDHWFAETIDHLDEAARVGLAKLPDGQGIAMAYAKRQIAGFESPDGGIPPSRLLIRQNDGTDWNDTFGEYSFGRQEFDSPKTVRELHYGPDGAFHLLYDYDSNGNQMAGYARFVAGGELIRKMIGIHRFCGLEVAPSAQPELFCHQRHSTNGSHLTLVEGEWSFTVVPNARTDAFVLDSVGQPHIAHFPADSYADDQRSFYQARVEGQWQKEPFSDFETQMTSYEGGELGLALGDNDEPHIVYHARHAGADGWHLYYTYRESRQWRTRQLTTTPVDYPKSAVAVDLHGDVRIILADRSTGISYWHFAH